MWVEQKMLGRILSLLYILLLINTFSLLNADVVYAEADLKGKVQTDSSTKLISPDNLKIRSVLRCKNSPNSDSGILSSLQPGNYASIFQFGSENAARIEQEGAGNIATTEQSGAKNTATTQQQGKNNIAQQYQSGISNNVSSIQIGNNNLSRQIQYGNGINSRITQVGNYGRILIRQGL